MSNNKLWFFAVILGLISAYVIVNVVNTKEQIIIEVPAVIEEDKEPNIKRETINDPLYITKGFYAISIDLSSDFKGVSGYILPGGIIDLYAYKISQQEGTEETEVEHELLLENVKVLASNNFSIDLYDEKVEKKNLIYSTITIEVSKEQIDKIISSQDKLYYAVLHHYEVEVVKEIEDEN